MRHLRRAQLGASVLREPAQTGLWRRQPADLANLLHLLNAEREYYSARIDYISGQYAETASAYKVFSGMGQLLDMLHVDLPPQAVSSCRLRVR